MAGLKQKIVLLRVFIFVTYYIKLFRTGADTHTGISMPLLVGQTIVDYLLSFWY